MNALLSQLRLSGFLAYKSVRRGNKGTMFLTILIMAMVFVNLLFISSLLKGIENLFNNQIVDVMQGHLMVEPKEGEGGEAE